MSLSPEQAEAVQYILDVVKVQQGHDPRNAVEEIRVCCVRLLDGTESLVPSPEPQAELPLETTDPAAAEPPDPEPF